MVAKTEEQLEAAYARDLGLQGETVARQVRISAGIADIVTEDAVIEVKLWLTRAALLSAVGQVTAYAAVLGKPRRVVFGYEADAPVGLIESIRRSGVEVVTWIAWGPSAPVGEIEMEDWYEPHAE